MVSGSHAGNSSKQGYKEIPIYPVLSLEANTPPPHPQDQGAFGSGAALDRPRQGRAWPEDGTAPASARAPGLPALLATSNSSFPRLLVTNKFGLLFLSFSSWQSTMHPQKGHLQLYHYHQKRDEKNRPPPHTGVLGARRCGASWRQEPRVEPIRSSSRWPRVSEPESWVSCSPCIRPVVLLVTMK